MKLLKVLFFVLGYAAVVAIPALSTLFDGQEIGETEQTVIITLLELAGVILMIVIYKLVYVRVFPSASKFRFSMPCGRLIAGIVLVYPLICLVKIVVIVLLKSPENIQYIWEPDLGLSEEKLLSYVYELPLVAFIGPALEELGCRVYPISSFDTRRGRVIAGIITMALFALLHISSWQNTVPGAILFTVLYIVTGNIAYPLICHMSNNLMTIMIPILSSLYMWLFPDTKLGVVGAPWPLAVIILLMFAAGLYLLISELKRARHRNA